MSFDFKWSKLDDRVSEELTQKLNAFFQNINTADSAVGGLKVLELDLGSTPPELELVDITEPFVEFYVPTSEELENLESRNLTPPKSELYNISIPEGPFEPNFEDPYGSVQPKINNNDFSAYHSQFNPSDSRINTQDESGPMFHITQDPASSIEGLDNEENEYKSYDHDILGISKDLSRFNLKYPFWRNRNFEVGLPRVGPRAYSEIKPPSMFSVNTFSSFDHNDRNVPNYYHERRIDENIPVQQRYAKPDISLIDPLPESSQIPSSFFEDEGAKNEVIYERSPDDIQFYFKLGYTGDISITLAAELRLNYPASSFMALPITCYVTNFKFSGIFVLAYIQNKINFCFLEPEPPRTSLLDDLTIRSEIGDDDQHVLKNVESVEKFIVEQLRKSIDENFVFPSYTSVEFEP
ncbi:hypothetical protein BB560_002432 [Smittium megazygosporum]|uniref:Mitochondrial distribution and morphology protein 12 n=1 Tax=Smittium megazygosporum TaxID=133381 RepID=A0A2T9ZF05_9FUNG|nr:hypothetical protein BB560_002432 [Smittium megazygosporum]